MNEAAKLAKELRREFAHIDKFELSPDALSTILPDMLKSKGDQELLLAVERIRFSYADALTLIARSYLQMKLTSDSGAGHSRVERLFQQVAKDSGLLADSLRTIFDAHELQSRIRLPPGWKPNFRRDIKHVGPEAFQFEEIMHMDFVRDQVVGPLIADLHEFVNIIKHTRDIENAAKRKERGRPMRHSFIFLVLQTKLLYEQGIVWADPELEPVAGQFKRGRAGVAWDGIKGVYTGPFVRIIRRLLQECGEKPRAEALGKSIQTALKSQRLKQAEARILSMEANRTME
jgi:hypothetical protein